MHLNGPAGRDLALTKVKILRRKSKLYIKTTTSVFGLKICSWPSHPHDKLLHKHQTHTYLHIHTKMKSTHYLWLAVLTVMVAALPVDESTTSPTRSWGNHALIKHDCNGGDCPCSDPINSFCTDSCQCQTACCNVLTALCQTLDDTRAIGGYCVGGEPG